MQGNHLIPSIFSLSPILAILRATYKTENVMSGVSLYVSRNI